MSLEATFNAVIVKPVKLEETLDSGIIVPDAGEGSNELGEIISVGPGMTSHSGAWIPTTLQVGDVVILPTMGFTRLTYKDEEYYVGPENQILGKVID